ncbi:MAG: Flp pilus assembly complex ATPase component TadA [Candidatus Omnitrophica bacterium]|nr:Flp pilus assembly complex ATPase component TadA [Candidatus Omnitrophota bacterium]
MHNYLKIMMEKQASDLYLKAGVPAHIRVEGKIFPADKDILSNEDLESVLNLLIDHRQKDVFSTEKEMDVSYEAPDIGRFRVNIYIQRGNASMVFRAVRREIRSFAELNLPVKVLEELSILPRGLVLITGTAGSGKSTTLAGMIEYINQNQRRHIIAIEDPVVQQGPLSQ